MKEGPVLPPYRANKLHPRQAEKGRKLDAAPIKERRYFPEEDAKPASKPVSALWEWTRNIGLFLLAPLTQYLTFWSAFKDARSKDQALNWNFLWSRVMPLVVNTGIYAALTYSAIAKVGIFATAFLGSSGSFAAVVPAPIVAFVFLTVLYVAGALIRYMGERFKDGIKTQEEGYDTTSTAQNALFGIPNSLAQTPSSFAPLAADLHKSSDSFAATVFTPLVVLSALVALSFGIYSVSSMIETGQALFFAGTLSYALLGYGIAVVSLFVARAITIKPEETPQVKALTSLSTLHKIAARPTQLTEAEKKAMAECLVDAALLTANTFNALFLQKKPSSAPDAAAPEEESIETVQKEEDIDFVLDLLYGDAPYAKAEKSLEEEKGPEAAPESLAEIFRTQGRQAAIEAAKGWLSFSSEQTEVERAERALQDQFLSALHAGRAYDDRDIAEAARQYLAATLFSYVEPGSEEAKQAQNYPALLARRLEGLARLHVENLPPGAPPTDPTSQQGEIAYFVNQHMQDLPTAIETLALVLTAIQVPEAKMHAVVEEKPLEAGPEIKQTDIPESAPVSHMAEAAQTAKAAYEAKIDTFHTELRSFFEEVKKQQGKGWQHAYEKESRNLAARGAQLESARDEQEEKEEGLAASLDRQYLPLQISQKIVQEEAWRPLLVAADNIDPRYLPLFHELEEKVHIRRTLHLAAQQAASRVGALKGDEDPAQIARLQAAAEQAYDAYTQADQAVQEDIQALQEQEAVFQESVGEANAQGHAFAEEVHAYNAQLDGYAEAWIQRMGGEEDLATYEAFKDRQKDLRAEEAQVKEQIAAANRALAAVQATQGRKHAAYNRLVQECIARVNSLRQAAPIDSAHANKSRLAAFSQAAIEQITLDPDKRITGYSYPAWMFFVSISSFLGAILLLGAFLGGQLGGVLSMPVVATGIFLLAMTAWFTGKRFVAHSHAGPYAEALILLSIVFSACTSILLSALFLPKAAIGIAVTLSVPAMVALGTAAALCLYALSYFAVHAYTYAANGPQARAAERKTSRYTGAKWFYILVEGLVIIPAAAALVLAGYAILMDVRIGLGVFNELKDYAYRLVTSSLGGALTGPQATIFVIGFAMATFVGALAAILFTMQDIAKRIKAIEKAADLERADIAEKSEASQTVAALKTIVPAVLKFATLISFPVIFTGVGFGYLNAQPAFIGITISMIAIIYVFSGNAMGGSARATQGEVPPKAPGVIGFFQWLNDGFNLLFGVVPLKSRGWLAAREGLVLTVMAGFSGLAMFLMSGSYTARLESIFNITGNTAAGIMLMIGIGVVFAYRLTKLAVVATVEAAPQPLPAAPLPIPPPAPAKTLNFVSDIKKMLPWPLPEKVTLKAISYEVTPLQYDPITYEDLHLPPLPPIPFVPVLKAEEKVEEKKRKLLRGLVISKVQRVLQCFKEQAEYQSQHAPSPAERAQYAQIAAFFNALMEAKQNVNLQNNFATCFCKEILRQLQYSLKDLSEEEIIDMVRTLSGEHISALFSNYATSPALFPEILEEKELTKDAHRAQQVLAALYDNGIAGRVQFPELNRALLQNLSAYEKTFVEVIGPNQGEEKYRRLVKTHPATACVCYRGGAPLAESAPQQDAKIAKPAYTVQMYDSQNAQIQAILQYIEAQLFTYRQKQPHAKGEGAHPAPLQQAAEASPENQAPPAPSGLEDLKEEEKEAFTPSPVAPEAEGGKKGEGGREAEIEPKPPPEERAAEASPLDKDEKEEEAPLHDLDAPLHADVIPANPVHAQEDAPEPPPDQPISPLSPEEVFLPPPEAEHAIAPIEEAKPLEKPDQIQADAQEAAPEPEHPIEPLASEEEGVLIAELGLFVKQAKEEVEITALAPNRIQENVAPGSTISKVWYQTENNTTYHIVSGLEGLQGFIHLARERYGVGHFYFSTIPLSPEEKEAYLQSQAFLAQQDQEEVPIPPPPLEEPLSPEKEVFIPPPPPPEIPPPPNSPLPDEDIPVAPVREQEPMLEQETVREQIPEAKITLPIPEQALIQEAIPIQARPSLQEIPTLPTTPSLAEAETTPSISEQLLTEEETPLEQHGPPAFVQDTPPLQTQTEEKEAEQVPLEEPDTPALALEPTLAQEVIPIQEQPFLQEIPISPLAETKITPPISEQLLTEEETPLEQHEPTHLQDFAFAAAEQHQQDQEEQKKKKEHEEKEEEEETEIEMVRKSVAFAAAEQYQQHQEEPEKKEEYGEKEEEEETEIEEARSLVLFYAQWLSYAGGEPKLEEHLREAKKKLAQLEAQKADAPVLNLARLGIQIDENFRIQATADTQYFKDEEAIPEEGEELVDIYIRTAEGQEKLLWKKSLGEKPDLENLTRLVQAQEKNADIGFHSVKTRYIPALHISVIEEPPADGEKNARIKVHWVSPSAAAGGIRPGDILDVVTQGENTFSAEENTLSLDALFTLSREQACHVMVIEGDTPESTAPMDAEVLDADKALEEEIIQVRERISLYTEQSKDPDLAPLLEKMLAHEVNKLMKLEARQAASRVPMEKEKPHISLAPLGIQIAPDFCIQAVDLRCFENNEEGPQEGDELTEVCVLGTDSQEEKSIWKRAPGEKPDLATLIKLVHTYDEGEIRFHYMKGKYIPALGIHVVEESTDWGAKHIKVQHASPLANALGIWPGDILDRVIQRNKTLSSEKINIDALLALSPEHACHVVIKDIDGKQSAIDIPAQPPALYTQDANLHFKAEEEEEKDIIKTNKKTAVLQIALDGNTMLFSFAGTREQNAQLQHTLLSHGLDVIVAIDPHTKQEHVIVSQEIGEGDKAEHIPLHGEKEYTFLQLDSLEAFEKIAVKGQYCLVTKEGKQTLYYAFEERKVERLDTQGTLNLNPYFSPTENSAVKKMSEKNLHAVMKRFHLAHSGVERNPLQLTRTYAAIHTALSDLVGNVPNTVSTKGEPENENTPLYLAQCRQFTAMTNTQLAAEAKKLPRKVKQLQVKSHVSEDNKNMYFSLPEPLPDALQKKLAEAGLECVQKEKGVLRVLVREHAAYTVPQEGKRKISEVDRTLLQGKFGEKGNYYLTKRSDQAPSVLYYCNAPGKFERLEVGDIPTFKHNKDDFWKKGMTQADVTRCGGITYRPYAETYTTLQTVLEEEGYVAEFNVDKSAVISDAISDETLRKEHADLASLLQGTYVEPPPKPKPTAAKPAPTAPGFGGLFHHPTPAAGKEPSKTPAPEVKKSH